MAALAAAACGDAGGERGPAATAVPDGWPPIDARPGDAGADGGDGVVDIQDRRDAEGQARLFGAREVIPVAIELDPAARARLEADPRSDWVPARITVDGRAFPLVGLKLKGGRGSFQRLRHKAVFKVDLDRFDPDAHLYGLRKLTFNNMVQDPTKMRERLASRAFALFGLPAPRVGYAEITVDGEPFGLYAHVETLDEVFLRRAFPGAHEGTLYEGADDQDLWARHIPFFDVDAGDADGRADLRALVGALDRATPATFEGEVGARVDLDQMRRFFAAEILIGHWDGYAQLRNNYYLYRRSDDGRFLFLPWGMDQTWMRTRSAFRGPGRLFRLCVDWAPCRLPYAEVVRELADRLEAHDWAREIAGLRAVTEGPFSRDRRTPTRPGQREAAIEDLLAFIAAHPDRIRASLRCLDPAADRDGDGTLGCAGDCDESDPDVYPGARDTCGDEIDQDCSGFTDDGPACPVCRPATMNPRARFLLCHRPERFGLARETCAAHGATLASIRSAAEQAFVVEAAFARRRTSWMIGYEDHAEEGDFRWMDGAPSGFTAWAEGEPNNTGGAEDCVVLSARHDGRWNDVYCGVYVPFVCRLPDDR